LTVKKQEEKKEKLIGKNPIRNRVGGPSKKMKILP
jgi:hypothetical protein